MKKVPFISAIAISVIFFVACGNDAGSVTNKTDSSAVIVPAPDNNSATNPSMADTAFSKDHSDTSRMKKDSSKMKQ